MEQQTKRKLKHNLNFVMLSILSGMFISIGGWAYLAVGALAGMVMFTFGLLAVVHMGSYLYTGTAGFKFNRKPTKLPLILIFNVVGTILMGLLTRCLNKPMMGAAEVVAGARLVSGWLNCGLLAIGCGLIMTVAVACAAEKRYLPLLFGVPVFIACGFPHSIADAFYYSACSWEFVSCTFWNIFKCWAAVVVGNFIGCNIPWACGYYLTKDI